MQTQTQKENEKKVTHDAKRTLTDAHVERGMKTHLAGVTDMTSLGLRLTAISKSSSFSMG